MRDQWCDFCQAQVQTLGFCLECGGSVKPMPDKNSATSAQVECPKCRAYHMTPGDCFGLNRGDEDPNALPLKHTVYSENMGDFLRLKGEL